MRRNNGPTATFVRILLAFIAIPLFTAGARPTPRKTRNEALRAQLVALVRRQPGIHLSQVLDQLKVSRGSARHQLGILEGMQLVATVRSTRAVHYFPSDLDTRMRETFALLLQGRILEVTRSIIRRPGIGQRELTGEVVISRKVLRGYVDRLAATNLIQEVREPRRRRYYPSAQLIEYAQRLDRTPALETFPR